MGQKLEELERALKLGDENEESGLFRNGRDDEPGSGFGWRHIITLHVFVGCFINNAIRTNMSVGIVAMVNHTALKARRQSESDFGVGGLANFSDGPNVINEGYHFCQDSLQNITIAVDKDGPFEWNEDLQGVILAAFFYGYIITQIPGGFLTGYVGPSWVFGLGTVWTAILTLLTPLAAQFGAGYLIALRFLEGLGGGVTWPAMQTLFAHWAPPSERTKLPAFAASGALFGTLTAFILSGILAESTFLGGWPAIFYVFGAMGCIWFAFWSLFVESSPEEHRWISEDEENYIVGSSHLATRERIQFAAIPWTQLVQSLPLWAAIVSHFTYNWSLYVLLTGLPIYFMEVLGFDARSNGIASALPYLCQGVIQALSGKAADMMRTHCGLSTTKVRKIFDCLVAVCSKIRNKTITSFAVAGISQLLPAIFVVSVGFVGCNHQLAIALVILAVGLAGLCGGGFFFNFLDLGPQYAGITYSISNTFATIPGIIGPSVTGALIKGAHGVDAVYAWRYVFFIAGAFYIFSSIFYVVFAKGELQPWARSRARRGSVPLRVRANKRRDRSRSIL